MTRYLIAGATGMLGQDLRDVLEGRDVTSLSRADLDVTDGEAVSRAAVDHDVIINAAAYTKVDEAETCEDDAFAVNAVGARNLARAAFEQGARMVQISTDYVFDGTATAPYREDAPCEPISAYGRTKAAGESFALEANPERTYIVRTAWLYGAHGPNFAKTMLRIAGAKDTWSVVNDQVGQPTWTRDLARQIALLLDSAAPAGIYHGTNSGRASWYEFARAILEESGLNPDRISPTDSSQFVRPAPRPAWSVLGHDRWNVVGLQPMRDWREALHDAVAAGVLRD